MFFFLVPLLLGFGLNLASAFTTVLSAWWGARHGQVASAVLRNALGIPLWVIGLALAAHAPSPLLFRPGLLVEAFGWLVVAAGALVILAALPALRWRAAAPSIHDTLVERGAYAHVRHPIYAAMFLEFAGFVLLKPTWPVAAACAIGIAWDVMQAKCEERDLLQRLPAYRSYMARVPRFVPRLRTRRPG